MSSAFVLAPVPAAARRRRANSRSSPSTNFVGRSRSGSSASCSSACTRSRSRRPSFRHAPHRSPHTPSASFVNFVDSPSDAKYIAAELLKSPNTPSYEQINAQLHALGYQAGFLQSTHQSPRPIFRRIFSKSQPSTPHASAHKELPPVPPVPKIPAPALPTKKNKKSAKTNVRPTMYAQDVQLAIFFDGGKEKDHIARAASKTTKGMTADKGLPAGGREVGGYKDERGMLWWDENEQWEWAALLPKEDGSNREESEWVDFECAFERRSSASSAYSDKSVEALIDELEELVATGAGAGAGADAGGRLGALPPRTVLAMPRTRGAKDQGSAYLFPVELAQKNNKPVFSPSATTSFGARRAKGAGRRRRASPPPPLTLAPPSPFGARTGNVVVGVVGPIASARHFKHSHSHSFDDSFVAREAEFAWAALVGERAPPKSAGLPKKSGKMVGLFKGFGKARKQGMF